MISPGELKGESKKVSAGFHQVEVGLAGTIDFKEFYDSCYNKQHWKELLSGLWMNTNNMPSWGLAERDPLTTVECGGKKIELLV